MTWKKFKVFDASLLEDEPPTVDRDRMSHLFHWQYGRWPSEAELSEVIRIRLKQDAQSRAYWTRYRLRLRAIRNPE